MDVDIDMNMDLDIDMDQYITSFHKITKACNSMVLAAVLLVKKLKSARAIKSKAKALKHCK